MTPHAERIAMAVRLLEDATRQIVSVLHDLPPAMHSRPLPGGWSPAQHVWHCSLVNEAFTQALNGEDGALKSFVGTSDYTDDAWNLDAPPRPWPAPDFMVPPADAATEGAVSRITASAARLAAAMNALAPGRAAAECVQLPWGVVSLYQLCEYGGGHTMRHLTQVLREMGAGV